MASDLDSRFHFVADVVLTSNKYGFGSRLRFHFVADEVITSSPLDDKFIKARDPV